MQLVATCRFAFLVSMVGASAFAQQVLSSFANTGTPCGGLYAHSLDGGADFDGDGYGDVVVGDPPCAVRIVSGATGLEIAKILAIDSGTYFGAKVAIVGDTNGDGSPEIGIGCPSNASLAIPGPGRVYVVSAQGTVIYAQSNGGSELGRAIASAGDFNADGRDDFVVGLQEGLGKVEVRSGISHGTLLVVTGQINSATLGIGRDVAAIGDVDGDGTDEIAASGGIGWIVRGSATLDVKEIGSTSRPLAGGRDITGDGVPDVAIGSVAPGFGGAVDVYSGASLAYFGGYGVQSPVPGTTFGGVVSVPGDLTGDGRADVVVGSGDPDSNYPVLPELGSAKKVWVVSLAAPGAATATVLTEPTTFGGAIASVGDINGNGSIEFAVKLQDTVNIYTGACGSFEPYMESAGICLGLGSIEPKLKGSGCATPGGIVQFDITKAPGKSAALFIFGIQQAFQPMAFGCALKVAPVLPAFLGPLPLLPIGASGPGVGFLTIAGKLPMPLPAATVTMQVFIPDATSPAGFASTNALEMRIE